MHCLVIGEQDAHLGRLGRYFKEHGWQVSLAPSTLSLAQDAAGATDLIILKSCADDGALRADIATMRRASSDSIIMVAGEFSLSARSRALLLGANEFVPHEIRLDLLQARVAALLRLRRQNFSAVYKVADLVVDVLHRRVQQDGKDLHLSHKEFQLLVIFVQRCGETVFRSEIIEKLWGDAGHAEDNTLENYVSRLRRKLRMAGRCQIVTVRGIGYRLETTSPDAS